MNSARLKLYPNRSRADGRLPELRKIIIASPQPTGPAPLGTIQVWLEFKARLIVGANK
jgi:hypothetical protein